MVVGADKFFQDLYVGLVKGLVEPEGFEEMQGGLLFFCPSQKRAEHFFRRFTPEFTLCPVAGSVVGGLQIVEEFGDGSLGDLWRGIELGFLGDNTPDTACFAVAAGIAKRPATATRTNVDGTSVKTIWPAVSVAMPARRPRKIAPIGLAPVSVVASPTDTAASTAMGGASGMGYNPPNKHASVFQRRLHAEGP